MASQSSTAAGAAYLTGSGSGCGSGDPPAQRKPKETMEIKIIQKIFFNPFLLYYGFVIIITYLFHLSSVMNQIFHNKIMIASSRDFTFRRQNLRQGLEKNEKSAYTNSPWQ